ncbi:28S ribosomal protein S14, mitochondrial-like isoform X2 [Portunus trituberculatus]|uniref:28S ribosomal protein S14, mitochondrial-like isoform X2 n=1 Tax=Portunus trituberculatus TaxID=210409 RepID=UPI001E1D0AB2|nr:28S ribosomal protein S14, mitochondrial-like isoform X2 [Portunus trituberculatus]
MMAAPMARLFTSGLLERIPVYNGFLVQGAASSFHTTAVTHKYPNWKMIKEVKHRKLVKEYAFERININAMRKNKILPAELKEIADEEIAALPRKSSISQLHKRCMLTSRPRGLVTRWRLSRIVWRNEADYNKLSGIQRAMW